MQYQIDDKPKALSMLMYGVQWWVVAVPSIIVMGAVAAALHFEGNTAAQELYMQKLFAVIGGSILIQSIWGHRLPLVVGPAVVLLTGVLASMSSGINAIYTGIFTGGIILSLLAVSGLLVKVQKIFTPRVVTVILILVTVAIMPVIIRLIFAGSDVVFSMVFSLFFVFGLILLNEKLPGVWKSTTLMWGIGIGCLVYFAFYGLPAPSEHTLDLSGFFIRPEFNPSVIISFVLCALALTVNEIGSIQAVGHMLRADNMAQRSVRGVGFTGLMNMVSGALGVIGPVDYSTSPGIISASGCASRYPLIVAGAGLVLCAFIPAVVPVLIYIPPLIMGALLFYIMSAQLSAGLQLLVRDNTVKDYQSGITIGLPVMMAILVSFAPREVMERLPEALLPIVGNGFIMGVLTVFVLEHLIFGKRK